MRKLACSVAAVLAVAVGAPLQAAAIDPAQDDTYVKSRANLEFRVPSLSDAEPAAQTAGGIEPTSSRSEGRDGDETIDVQVNDPALDHILRFPTITPPTRPFELATQSEVSVAAFGRNIVVGYNSSADQRIVQSGDSLVFVHRHFAGFSASHDGGRTWTSGFLPPAADSPNTDGDPALAVDRAGNFYYATLNATDVIVSKSTDGGTTFGQAVIAAVDPGNDKEWIAVGPDPAARSHDNVYVTWTSFQRASSELWLTRSSDGGRTWTQKRLFAPVDGGPRGMSAFIQFSNPVVDSSTGRLYVPFLHFSNFDADFIKVLVSDDGGNTFSFLRFDVPGAPDPFGFPNVTPGIISDCGLRSGGVRLVLHQGPNLGGGRFGLPRYKQSTRLISQPSAAAGQGRLFIALNSSTSATLGDPGSRSAIRLLFTLDGGATWAAPVTVVPGTAADPQHVHPSLTMDSDGQRLSIGYYVQQANERLRVDMVRGEVGDEGGVKFEPPQRVSTTDFDMTPSNIPFPIVGNPFFTTNFDRTVRPCYNIGEYMSALSTQDGVLVSWGDNRRPWTSPPDSPAAGRHAQPDVFFRRGDE